MLRRSRDVAAMVLTFRITDFARMLPVLEEAADQSGIQLDIQGNPPAGPR
jgi:hypothetical protein